MAQRRRAQAEFEATQTKLGSQTVTLADVVSGYNGYSNPELLSPQFWAAASQVYGGLFGSIRRARFATIINASVLGGNASGQRMASMFSFSPVGGVPYLLLDTQNSIFGASPVINKYGTSSIANVTNLTGILNPASLLFGPFQRIVFGTAIILQANGQIRSKLFFVFATGVFNLEFWGLDAPDVSPQITVSVGLSATIAASPTGAVRTSNVATITTTANHGFSTGQFVTITGVSDTSFNSLTGATQQITVTGLTTFTYANIGPNTTSGSGTATVQITKTVGRSYQYAWENANTGHVSAPSPASQFVKYNNQIGTVDCIESGTVAINNGSTAVVGTNTQFTSAWIGRFMWIENTGSFFYPISSVTDATHLTLGLALQTANVSGTRFQIFDQQSTHIRLYETGDGGSVYFRTARNALNFSNAGLSGTGLEFIDTSNSEPPNTPFTSEIVQNFNVPPPIGQFLADYQGRPIVFGVPGALQSFFYGNIETTVVGQPPESFAPLNQVTLPVGDGQLNGWANLPTGAIIWSNRQDMFKLTGLLTDNTVSNQFQLGATIQRLPYRMGSGSPYANAVTNLGVFWLTESRQVQLFTDHYAPKNVGFPIQDILNRINGRINFARMKNYKRGERNWLALALSLDNSAFNNKLCLLDLDLLASNGQPSFFTFDMATNQPTWYLFDINCESIEQAVDSLNQQHLLAGDVDLVTDADYHTNDFAISENTVTGGAVTLHALGNEAPEVMKQLDWMRANTNQLPNAIAAQGWSFGVLKYDDEQWVLGAANSGNLVSLVPGVNSPSIVIGLENSPADFRFDGSQFAKGRRFQLKANFPTTPGNWEFRGFQVRYTGLYER